MTRRRVLVVAIGTVFVIGTWLWLCADHLSSEETALVGTWRPAGADPKRTYTVTFVTNRQWSNATYNEPFLRGRWTFRNGVLVVDEERSLMRRVLRPLAPLFGLRARPVLRVAAEVGTDRLVFIYPDGYREVYDRVPAD
jgi:hypothetical protein